MTIMEDTWRKGKKKCVGMVEVLKRREKSANKDEQKRRLKKRWRKRKRRKR